MVYITLFSHPFLLNFCKGTYLSTRHRVVAPQDKTMQTLNRYNYYLILKSLYKPTYDRYSVVYFCMPNWETEVKPLSKFDNNSQEPTYLFGELMPFY